MRRIDSSVTTATVWTARKARARRRLQAWVAIAWLLGTGACHGATYYLDTQQQFEARKNATFAPGDTILLRRGVVFSGMFAPQGSGAPGAPIVLEAYGSGAMPIVNAMGVNTAGVYLRNVEQWEVRNLEITNTDGSTNDQGERFGIYIAVDAPLRADMNHYRVSGCHIHDVNGHVEGKDRGGIHVAASGPQPFRINDLQIVSNTLADIGGVGIANRSTHVDLPGGNDTYLWTGVYVAHNYISRTGRNGIIARVSKDAVYEYNTVAFSSRYSTGHSIYNFETDGIVFQYNEAFGNTGSGTVDRGGFDADYNARDTMFQYNYSHDNHWFMGIMCRWNKGVTIRYNISQNETKGLYWYGFDDESGVEEVLIHNNVHYTAAGLVGVLLNAGNRRPQNTAFRNNIFYFAGAGSYGSNAASSANVTFSHNAFHGIPVWPYGGDAHAVTADPLLAAPGTGGAAMDMSDPNRLAGYRLQAGSPCRDAGRFMAGAAADFWGRPVPSGGATDIGAHEWQADNAPPAVSLTSPGAGAVIVLPDAIRFAASAVDGDGWVVKVDFYLDGTKIGVDVTAPYEFIWLAPAGVYALTAVAEDNEGARSASAPVSITVAPVLPDIKVNGLDGPLTLRATAAISVTLRLDSGVLAGQSADWFVVAHDVTADVWHQYVAPFSATSWRAPWLGPSYQGPLFALPFHEALSIVGLPAGLYRFYFGIDRIPNGWLDLEAVYYDVVEVNVIP